MRYLSIVIVLVASMACGHVQVKQDLPSYRRYKEELPPSAPSSVSSNVIQSDAGGSGGGCYLKISLDNL